MIKKTLITLTALATLAAESITTQAAPQDLNTKNIYPKTFIVYEIDREYDIIYLTDGNGFEWEYEGVEDWHAGDFAAATMNDNGTPKIKDDKILNLHFAGWNIYDDFNYDDCLNR